MTPATPRHRERPDYMHAESFLKLHAKGKPFRIPNEYKHECEHDTRTHPAPAAQAKPANRALEDMLCDSCDNHTIEGDKRTCKAGIVLNPYIWGCITSWRRRNE